jgi:hypothetical protein
VLLSVEGLVCQHCEGAVEYRPWGDPVEIADDDKLVNYRAVCVANCQRFRETAEAVGGPEGEYSVWESRY